MNIFEERIKMFLHDNKIDAEHLHFEQSCHSIKEAALAANVTPDDFVKNICMIDSEGNLIVAIIKGEDRVSTEQVSKVLGIERPRLATEQEVLDKTSYPMGCTPSFGYNAKFLIDPKVMQKEIVYT